MKLAYIILVHKNPFQLVRLLNQLDNTKVNFFVHIDKNVDFYLFKRVLQNFPKSKLRFIKREKLRWGGIGIIYAILNGIQEVLKSNERYDFLILLSGQDYPIKNNFQIIDFFERNQGISFIKHYPLPYPGWSNDGMDRIEKYNFFIKGEHRKFPEEVKPKSLTRKAFNMFCTLYFPLPRKFPNYVKPYGGSMWWCLTSEVARFVIYFVNKHPDYLKFHRYTFAPDEIFFQTIILNSKEKNILNSISRDNLTYTLWERTGAPHPAILKKDDLENLMSSEKLFARKFDVNIDSIILDKLDERLKTRNP